jgi:Trypsin-like peptidase domain
VRAATRACATGLCLLAGLLATVAAHAQAPGFYNTPGETQPGPPPAPDGSFQPIGGNNPPPRTPDGKPNPDARLERSCRMRRRVRICRYTRAGRLVRTCTTRPGRRRRCTRARGATSTARIWSGYTNPPLAAVVQVRLDGRAFCSGTLIMPAVVLTAAHCLYGNRTDGAGAGFYGSTGALTVTPGSFIDDQGALHRPYGTFRVRASAVPTRWQYEDGGQDWAIALVARNRARRLPGALTGTYTAYANIAVRAPTRFYNVGYPADGPFSLNPYGQYFCDTVWDGRNANGPAYTASSFALLTSPCELNGGSSGGPVFVQFSDGRWGIVGVNNRGVRRPDGFGSYGITFYFDGDFAAFLNDALGSIRARQSLGGAALALH